MAYGRIFKGVELALGWSVTNGATQPSFNIAVQRSNLVRRLSAFTALGAVSDTQGMCVTQVVTAGVHL